VIFGFSKVFVAGDYLLGWLLRPIINLIYPINHINGERHLILIPKAVEKFLGSILHSTLSNDYETNELIRSGSISEKVKQVFNRLIERNSKLINPASESVKFNYRVKTIPSSQINAFAVAGGGITVFSRIVRELDESLQKKSIKHAVITFPSGSKLNVDLSKVKIDDVLAALLGHEITHAASRHTNLQLTFLFIAKIITFIGNFLFVRSLQAKDDEYQSLKSKKANQLTLKETERLKELEKKYIKISDCLYWIEDKLNYFINLFKSRQNEYEADVTGIYIANNAGYDPLGALYLQEFLKQYSSSFLHKNFEFLFTHPYSENRKLAAFAAINEIDQRTLKRTCN
jgi:predicted Zn-dependent protease